MSSKSETEAELLTDVMIQAIGEIFSLFDKDLDGLVQTSYLRALIRGLNFDPSEPELAEMMLIVDPVGRGDFDQNALITLIKIIVT